MGIVERLRGTIDEWDRANDYAEPARSIVRVEVGDALRNNNNQAADLIERLKGYADHAWNCPVSVGQPDDTCDCGLTALIKEIDNG